MLVLNLQTKELNLALVGTLFLLLELDVKFLELLLSEELNLSVRLLGHMLFLLKIEFLFLNIELLFLYCIIVLQHACQTMMLDVFALLVQLIDLCHQYILPI